MTGLGKLNHMRVSLTGVNLVFSWLVGGLSISLAGRPQADWRRRWCGYLPCHEGRGAMVAQFAVRSEGIVLGPIIFDDYPCLEESLELRAV